MPDDDHPAGEHHLDEHDVFYDLDDGSPDDLFDVGAVLLEQLVEHHAGDDGRSGPDYGCARAADDHGPGRHDDDHHRRG